jgi:ferrochelatase
VKEDYELIGGKSPIFFDTEEIAMRLSQKLQAPVIPFHRYLPSTHANFFKQVAAKKTTVLPLFPQYCSATTGSIVRFFSEKLSIDLNWIRSYADHPSFISAFQRRIRDFLTEKNLGEEETLLLFSAHGVPKTFIKQGDPYEKECNLSFQAILKGFPKAEGLLCYQSKFGRGEWLKPYTNEICEQIKTVTSRKNVVIVPLSFTSDHIETLFEIEYLYVTAINVSGLHGYRCPALNLQSYWIEALADIAKN